MLASARRCTMVPEPNEEAGHDGSTGEDEVWRRLEYGLEPAGNGDAEPDLLRASGEPLPEQPDEGSPPGA
jgi:hypothetical protein